MSLENKWNNVKLAYSKKETYVVTIISSLLMAAILFYFTDIPSIVGNLGLIYAYTLIITQIILSILFGVNIGLLWFKLRLTSGFDSKAQGTTALGSVLAIIVSGCPACGITLAGYLGIASIFSSLPLFGLELKFVGIGLLLYSSNYIVKNISSCNLPKR